MKICSALIISSGLCLVAVVPGAASAQSSWPTSAVRVLVANSPGTATDLAARVYSDNLSRVVGMSVVLVGPALMPAGLAERINKASAGVVENPKFNQDLASLPWRNAAGAQTPQGTAELMRRARFEWGVFIKEAGITPE